MAATRAEIIVYAYEMAPNPRKLVQFLSFFGIPYKFVEIPVIMPRPQLAEIGITYRRTPLLSINSDMYVDTSLIISRLSDIAQHSDCGLDDATNHLEFDGLGQQGVQLSIGLIPADSFMFKDQAFIADRSDFIGRPFNGQAIANARPQTISKMLSFVQLIEGHFLKGNRKFVLGGDKPTTADMHLYWGLEWGLRFLEGGKPEITPSTRPKIFGWFDAVKQFIDSRKAETKISMDDAYKVLRVPPKHEYAKFVPHVEENPEGLKPGQKVKVTPTDSGRSGPQLGELISLNYEQVCLRNEKGLVMHFPRMGYEVVSDAPKGSL